MVRITTLHMKSSPVLPELTSGSLSWDAIGEAVGCYVGGKAFAVGFTIVDRHEAKAKVKAEHRDSFEGN